MKPMATIDASKLQADMATNGYNNDRLAILLRCSGSTIGNVLRRGTMDLADLRICESVFGREVGYYNDNSVSVPTTTSQGDADALYNLVAKMNTDISQFLSKQQEEMTLLNSTMQMVLVALDKLNKSLSRLEGVEKDNTAKVVTAVSKMRTDTEMIKSSVKTIERKVQ